MKIPTIHRDGSFEFKGMRYRVSQGSDTPTLDGSRFVYREDEDYTLMADGFGYMYEVREWLARAVREDWPDLNEEAITQAAPTQPSKEERELALDPVVTTHNMNVRRVAVSRPPGF